jgi:hypothetical protein
VNDFDLNVCSPLTFGVRSLIKYEDIMCSQIKSQSGIQSLPLHLVSSWSVDTRQIAFQLDYSYSGAALSQPCPLNNVNIVVPVDAPVTGLVSQPVGSWLEQDIALFAVLKCAMKREMLNVIPVVTAVACLLSIKAVIRLECLNEPDGSTSFFTVGRLKIGVLCGKLVMFHLPQKMADEAV